MFFIFRVQINREYQNLKDKYFPCRYPITQSLGTIDSRFNISQDEFLQSIDQATQIWDNVVGKQLFKYELDGDLKINLKYDTRQATSSKMSDIDTNVNNDKGSYNGLKSQYDSLKSDIDASRNNVRTQNDVEILNQKINTLNQIAGELNQSAQNINSQVSTYNNMGNSLGGEFEEGLFYSDKNGRGIDIYEFKSKTNLVRLLTHELGHALSLEHSQDPNAIMYYLENSDSLTPSGDDISALKTHCGIK